MPNQANTFSPQDFTKRLRSGELAQPVVLTGLVKDGDSTDDALMFSLDGCASWTSIPHALIAQVEFLKQVTCTDHTHPLVSLQLKPSEQPEVRAAFSLLASVLKKAVPPDTSDAMRWQSETKFEECAQCLNDCLALPDHRQRVRCIKRCKC